MRHSLDPKTLPKLSVVSDAHLTELALWGALDMKPFAPLLGRAGRVNKEASRNSQVVGSGRRCSPHQRCGNLSCLISRARSQRYELAKHAGALQQVCKQANRARTTGPLGAVLAITLIPSWGRLSMDGNDPTLPGFVRKVRRVIECVAPAAAGYFCVEPSWDDCSRVGRPDHCQLHVHGVIAKISLRELKTLKSKLRDDSRVVHKPVWVKTLIHPVGWLAYMTKPEFGMREIRTTDDGFQRSRPGDLTLDQEVTMSRWLSAYRVDQRFFRIGDMAQAAASLRQNKHKNPAI